ncbi:hypothetical protein [Mycolicibacterium austroafricanum]|uniref:hypothetical protein n=1 Tax=Mycolicibacterium austroafricanum TaxID=39687 RepID=UPI001CA3033E|nr:hypothetical protein [Mycolicibacterium austroafricanum]QZT57883.1 hypothetical protein JN084_04520 [Mycolicibacterium austroafricanum]
MNSDFGPDGASSPTVLCPHGHINAWNYKFCGECGAAIGVVAWPDETVASDDAPSTGRRVALTAIVATAVVAVVVAAVVGFLALRPSSDDDAGARPDAFGSAATAIPALAIPCTEGPVVQAESVDMTPEGLSVSAAFLTPCPGGDTVAGTGVRITVADGQRDIAAGLFDFSAQPVRLEPGAKAHRKLVFPDGMYWRTPDMFSGAPQLVLHPGEEAETASARSGAETLVAQEPAKPEHGSVDGVAEAVLKELRDADSQYVNSSVANRWVPQISSKKAGLVVDGKTLSSADVLRDHLELRRKYSGVRLTHSGQWTTFSSPDWWVTVVGIPKLSASEANRWCDTQGLGVDDCFAKFVSSCFGVEGTTVYRK